MTNYRAKVEADKLARDAWMRTDRALGTNWLKSDKDAQTRWYQTDRAIAADTTISYQKRTDRASAAYRAYEAEKSQNWTNYQNGKNLAWQAFQDRLVQNAATYARLEEARRAYEAGQKAQNGQGAGRGQNGQFTAKAPKVTNRPSWDNGDRSAQTFRNLCKKHHPDMGGDTATFREILVAFGR